MKIGLDIKNMAKAVRPKNGDVIIHDGKGWYITTKEDLFKEYDERFSAMLSECHKALAECEKRLADMNDVKVNVAKQILAIQEIVSRLIEKENAI